MTGVEASELRTGLLIDVAAADELVHPYRRRRSAVSVARRLPPHVDRVALFEEQRDKTWCVVARFDLR